MEVKLIEMLLTMTFYFDESLSLYSYLTIVFNFLVVWIFNYYFHMVVMCRKGLSFRKFLCKNIAAVFVRGLNKA